MPSNLIIQKLWATACNLSVALNKYCHPDIFERGNHERSLLNEKPDAEIDGISNMPVGSITFSTGIGRHLEGLPHALRKVELEAKIQGEIRQYVIHRLWTEHLVAIGFTLPRKLEDPPVRIPSDVWNGKIDWKKNTVDGGGLSFVQVRVITRSELEASLPSDGAPPASPMPTKLGRPSLKQDISEMFNELAIMNALNFQASMAKTYPVIRKALSKKYPDRQGIFDNISDETIRKVISPIFKERKNSNKQ